MSVIRFSDGVNIDTSGEYRIIHRYDGCYVVGRGMLIPVADEDEGKSVIAMLTRNEH